MTGITVADIDAGTGAVTATLTAATGTLAATAGGGVTVSGSGTGTLALTGSTTAINAFIAGSNVDYVPAANAETDTTLTVQVNDNGNTGGGAQTSAPAVVTLDLQPANDAPVPSGGAAPIDVTPGRAVTAILSPTLFTDVDLNDTLTLSLTADSGGALPGWMTFDPSTGALTLDPPSTTTGTVTLRLVATDGSGATAAQPVTVRIVAAQAGVPEFRATPPQQPVSIAVPGDPAPAEPPPPAPVLTPIGGSNGDTPGTSQIGRFFDAGGAGFAASPTGQVFQQAAFQASGTSSLANGFGSGGGQLFSFGGGGWSGYGLQGLGIGGGLGAGGGGTGSGNDGAEGGGFGTGETPTGAGPDGTGQPDAPTTPTDGSPASGPGGEAPPAPQDAPPAEEAPADEAALETLDPVALALLGRLPEDPAVPGEADLAALSAADGAEEPTAGNAPGFQAQLNRAAFGFEREAATVARALSAVPLA